MSAPPINIEDYGLSRTLGFLSDTPPLTSFSDNNFSSCDDLVRHLPHLIASKTLRNEVRKLPELDVQSLATDAGRHRAYVVLAFLVHGYVWMDLPHDVDAEAALVPHQLAEPFLAICETLGVEPVLSYAGLCLWNWTPHGGSESYQGRCFQLENLASLGSFTGTPGEDAFYHVPVLIEAEGGPLVSLLLETTQAAEDGRVQAVIEVLQRTAETIVRMRGHLPQLYQALDGSFFYHDLRPYLSGGKGMEAKGLPRGFVFEKDDGSHQEVKCVGGSAAQSSLFQFLDLVLGVNHSGSGNASESLFEAMRAYMPRLHRDFLKAVAQRPSLRVFVQKSDNEALTCAYNDCLKELRQWRSSHIAVVSKYIVRPARSANVSAADQSRPDDDDDDSLKGTAGSALIPFLKQARAETDAVRI